jgi:hypothetical protein
MRATAIVPVRRQQRMRICLQARRNTLTLRSNLRLPQTMPPEADICRNRPVPTLQAAGGHKELYVSCLD